MALYEHKDAIRELLAEYCFRLDAHDFPAFAQLFTAQGEWLSRNGDARGPAAIEKLLAAMLPPEAQRKHFTTNIIIRFENEARAQVRSNFLVVRQSEAGPVIAVAGTYEDVVVLQEGQWRFASRRLFHDIAGASGLNTVAAR